MMNENNIRQLIERFLNAETTLEEEQTLYEYFSVGNASKRCIVGNASERCIVGNASERYIPDDLKPYIEVFQSFAVVKGIDKPVTKSTPAWVIALRTVTSMAAVFLIGLFLFVNEETPETPQMTTATAQTEYMPDLCEGSTPRELYMCYLEQKREQPKTYSLIKRMIYENEH
ncbi:MAG: hypothetical protein IJ887_12310 [Prevotella sp.]|nr:hypothetical protein [Prevotella sp.]MBR3479537.1 hypothetical protein [Prevotella sp.]